MLTNADSIRSAAVLGSGTMGHGIAQVLAMAGLEGFADRLPRELSGGMRPNTVMPGLCRDWQTASSIFQFWPNFAWILNPNLLVLYWVDPISPTRTRIRWEWLVPDTAEARAASESAEMPLRSWARVTLAQGLITGQRTWRWRRLT